MRLASVYLGGIGFRGGGGVSAVAKPFLGTQRRGEEVNRAKARNAYEAALAQGIRGVYRAVYLAECVGDEGAASDLSDIRLMLGEMLEESVLNKRHRCMKDQLELDLPF
jgi:hypothetical protein